MSREIAPFGLRMPTELRSRLQEKADKNNRSLNAEIVYQLQQMDNKQSLHTKLDQIINLLTSET